MSVLAYLAAFSGIFLGLSGLPQAVKIFRTKSARDISPTSNLIVAAGAVIWVLYGMELKNPAIVIPNVLGCATAVAILAGYIRYGTKRRARI